MDVEKVCREQMMVAVPNTSIDALDLNSRLDARSLRLGTVENNRPRKIGKLTGDTGRELADLETQF